MHQPETGPPNVIKSGCKQFMIAIIDYRISNVKSIKRACDLIGHDTIVTSAPEDICAADRIILPGVGSFEQGMENLRKFNLLKTLHNEVIGKKKPILGICLGMQLVFSTGYENGLHKGLGWLQGECVKLSSADSNLRLPHMGWNDVTILNEDPLFSQVGEIP